MSDQKMIPSCGINYFNLEFIVGPASKQSLFSSVGQAPLRASSSATKEIVTLTNCETIIPYQLVNKNKQIVRLNHIKRL